MKHSTSKVNGAPLESCSEPSYWQYAGLHEALLANISLIAALITQGCEIADGQRAHFPQEAASSQKGA